MSMSNLSNKVYIYESFLPNEDALQILSYADTLSINKPSFVFNTKTKENETNVAVRKSQSITVNDIHAVDFIKSTILDQFEKSNSDLVVKLARDYVTFIKYSAGEFFEWHRDHERYVINQRDRWIEAHLIYCLKAPQVGGNLDIKSNENIQSIAYQYNQCVVFDKLMEHRAAEVQEGEKLIMTVDVLISTKEIASDESLDFELAEAMKDPVGVRSYRVDKINQLHDAHKQSIMFGLIIVGSITVIYDSVGYYYYDDSEWHHRCFIRKDDCFVEYNQTDLSLCESSYPYFRAKYYNNDDLTSLMLNQTERYDVKDGHIDSYPMNCSPPIPDGTDPLAILKIKCCHIPKKMETISYTYYCNEGDEYEVSIVDHSCGILHFIGAS